MKRIIALVIAGSLLAILPLGVECRESQNQEMNFVPGEFIIKFVDDVDFTLSNGILITGIQSIDELNQKYNVVSSEHIFTKSRITSLNNIYKFVLDDDADIISISKEYSKDPTVVYAEPNYIAHMFVIPNDPDFYEQWSLHQSNDCDVDGPQAWNIETGDSETVISIIDLGVEHTHSDLSENIWINDAEDINGNGHFDNSPAGQGGDIDNIDNDNNGFVDDVIGWDFYDNDNTPGPYYHWHGTHCAGIACAMTNNNIGISGASWNCRIMPTVGLGPTGSGDIEDLVNCIYYSADNGADVLSMSWGSNENSQTLKDAIDYAYNQGSVLIAAAGNDNTDEKMYPAAYENVIAVAATNQQDLKADFSNYGDWVDIAAPGVSIYSTSTSNGYRNADGTSMACPLVAGIAGLVLSKNLGLSNELVRDIIINSVDKFPYSETHLMGKGRISALEAVLRGPGPAEAEVTSPTHFSSAKGTVDVEGSASGEGFQYFTIEYCEGWHSDEAVWIEVQNSITPVDDGLLCSFDTGSANDGPSSLRLSVICNNGIYRDTICFIINEQPEKPEKPSGTEKGTLYMLHEYSTKTTDLENNQIYYMFEWGDGSTSSWIGPYDSSETAKCTHIWTKQGAFTIRVKAKDTYNAESEWSDPLPVVMPREKTTNMFLLKFLDKIFERFQQILPMLKQILT